jgi:hypothetical protein
MQSVSDKIANKIRYMAREQQEQVLAYVESLLPPPKTMLEIVKDIQESIPQDVLDKLPTDGAENHDHYLYGAPKK